MRITYDPVKNQKNIRDRELSFERAAEFCWIDAKVKEDSRKEYSETRFIAVGYLENRLHVLCFTETEEGIRVISFRKANIREVSHYEKTYTIN